MSFLHWPSFLLPGQVAVISRQCQPGGADFSNQRNRVFWAVNSLASQVSRAARVNSDYDQTDLTYNWTPCRQPGSCSSTIRQRTTASRT